MQLKGGLEKYHRRVVQGNTGVSSSSSKSPWAQCVFFFQMSQQCVKMKKLWKKKRNKYIYSEPSCTYRHVQRNGHRCKVARAAAAEESSTFFAQHCVLCFPLILRHIHGSCFPTPAALLLLIFILVLLGTASCLLPPASYPSPHARCPLMRWHTRCTFKCPTAAATPAEGQQESNAKANHKGKKRKK